MWMRRAADPRPMMATLIRGDMRSLISGVRFRTGDIQLLSGLLFTQVKRTNTSKVARLALTRSASFIPNHLEAGRMSQTRARREPMRAGTLEVHAGFSDVDRPAERIASPSRLLY